MLGDYLNRHLESRTDLKLRTKKLHDMTCRYLRTYFGDYIHVDRISRAAANANIRDWCHSWGQVKNGIGYG